VASGMAFGATARRVFERGMAAARIFALLRHRPGGSGRHGVLA
jgi:hypothetical protein